MRLASSFRDPHGFVFERDGIIYRQVNEAHEAHFAAFLSSGLYERLVQEGLLVRHEEVTLDLAAEPGAIHVLRPERIQFVSYPYEWGFLQLRDAATLTLRVQELALDHGMSLRDASAFNVAFRGSRPVFIDTTSFEILPEGRPWVAYRQFCEHFLAPLALMAYRDVRMGQLTRVWLDGIPLDLAAGLLPSRASVRPGLAMHLRMHARTQRTRASDRSSRDRTFSPQAFRGLIESLLKAVEGLTEPAGYSVWRDYYGEADHYTDAAAREKERVVASWLEELQPTCVWDLGANTGRFARLASSSADTVAFDLDPFCVDEAYRRARADGDERLLPLVMDLANPSPGVGWMNEERSGVWARGSADLVLALALIHHLAIGRNVPLPAFAETLSRSGRHAIVEWVPKDDPKVTVLLRDRADVFGGYSREGFEAAMAPHFHVGGVEPLPGSDRLLYRLRRR